jgi:hypothetical protein
MTEFGLAQSKIAAAPANRLVILGPLFSEVDEVAQMSVASSALMTEVAQTSGSLSRLLVTNGVFVIMAVLLLLGTLTLQLARDHSTSRNGAPAYGE